MADRLSKAQVDQLGERIRGGVLSESDLKLLDSYRLSFAPAYENVVGRIRTELGLEPTGRPTKSTTSITDKLSRETIRLSQMQDIAGCRVVVSDLVAQDSIVSALTGMFGAATVFDRRDRPSHGYRAVHVVAKYLERPVEIQVRTTLQHVWAELSEKLSDVVDVAVKYGGGPHDLVTTLLKLSRITANFELLEKRVEGFKTGARKSDEIAEIAMSLGKAKNEFGNALQEVIRDPHSWRGT